MNIASHLRRMASEAPDRDALILPAGRRGGKAQWRRWTFAELEAESNAYARGLRRIGIGEGTRTVLMVRPSLDFFALVFGMLKAGAVLVLIDPAIGRRALLSCLSEVEPEAFIGVPEAQVARLLFPGPFAKVRQVVTAGRRWFWGGHTLRSLRDPGPFDVVEPPPDTCAAILFTSGSTGIPKGAIYGHGIFEAQIDAIRSTYGFEPGEREVATFPLFALFGPALGLTVIVPDMDARFPAKARPERIVEAISDHDATSLFASPALLDNLSRHASKCGHTFTSLRRVLSAGAPVRYDILERMAGCLPEGVQVFTPFGATESLPVASIGSDEVLSETGERTRAGAGICVGKPLPNIDLRIAKISDDPIERWTDDLSLPHGEIGEIVVGGPVVTQGYWARPDQDRLSKIRDGERLLHRMGDLGYLDDAGRLWMCGRKSHRVESESRLLCTVPLEQIFNQHPAVRRSALVGVGARPNQLPALVVETETGKAPSPSERQRLEAELRALAAEHPLAREIPHILFYGGVFPVDVRHNAKIDRERLTEWAASRLAEGEEAAA